MTIEKIIPRGEENALTGFELAQISGFTLRQVTRQIEMARKNGVPIAANSSGGYFVATTGAEMRNYLRLLNHRVRSYHATLSAIKETIERMEGQLALEGGDLGGKGEAERE